MVFFAEETPYPDDNSRKRPLVAVIPLIGSSNNRHSTIRKVGGSNTDEVIGLLQFT
jgi:hypothetical protein